MDNEVHKPLNLHQRINKVCSAIENLQKNTMVGKPGRGGYKSINASQVISVVDPLMSQYGLTLLPIKQDLGDLKIREYVDDYSKSKLQFIQQSNFTYRLSNADKPEEFIEIQSASIGIDPLDKGTGKASTYALKTLLCVIFRIPSSDDPDLIHSDDVEPSINQAPVPTTKQERDVIVACGLLIGLCKQGKADDAYDSIAEMKVDLRKNVLQDLKTHYLKSYNMIENSDKWKTAMANKQQTNNKPTEKTSE